MEHGPISFLVRAGRLAYLAYEEGRLPLSPRRWWADLRHLRGVVAAERTQALTGDDVDRRMAGRPARVGPSPNLARHDFQSFLASDARLRFGRAAEPALSIVVVLADEPALSYRCLRSLESCTPNIELVLTGHVSSKGNDALLSRVQNALIASGEAGEGFAVAANRGARVASASAVLFLDGRLELHDGAIETLTAALDASTDIGVVGARLLGSDGRLTEAGCIVWRDGTLHPYGHGGSPLAPQYCFTRDVDGCSAELLITRRAQFVSLGGFDPAFSSPSGVGSDYCIRSWESGARVLYEPRATATLHAPGKETTAAAASTLAQKHAVWLSGQMPDNVARVLAARVRQPRGQRIVVFDDRVPHASSGLGFPRALELLRALTDLGHFVTVFPLSFTTENWPSVYADIPRSIEVMTDYGPARLNEFWSARRGYYDTAIVSRHHNMQRMRSRFGDPTTWGVQVIYDAEALVAHRRISESQITGERVDGGRLIDEEVRAARGVDAILSVSEQEAQVFRSAIDARVVVARHAVIADPTERSFSDRHGLLFVGAFDPLSPNTDSVLWFVRDVLPRIEQLLQSPVPLTIVGHGVPRNVRALNSSTVTVVADAADLRPFYDAARLFVAPTRFAAGIPLKVVHAAAHGLPVVCTPLLGRQLGWTHGADLMTAESPDEFASSCAELYSDGEQWRRLRANSLSRLAREYSRASFATALASAVSTGVRPTATEILAAQERRDTHR